MKMLAVRASLAAAGVIATLGTAQVSASTTTEKTGICSYRDAGGRVVFDGTCKINWGVGPAEGCEGGADFAQRYVVTFSPRSEATFYFLCDESVEVNGATGTYKETRHGPVPVVQVRTKAGETFEFATTGE